MEIEYPSVSTTYILPYDSDFLGTLLIRNFFSLMIFFFTVLGFGVNAITLFIIFVLGITQRSAGRRRRVGSNFYIYKLMNYKSHIEFHKLL